MRTYTNIAVAALLLLGCVGAFAETMIGVQGAEGGNATFYIYADQGDDAADKFTIVATTSGTLLIQANGSTLMTFGGTGDLIVTDTATNATLTVLGVENSDASLILDADDGDDNADTWTITSEASGNDLSVLNHTTEVLNLTSAGALQIDGDLTVSGNDIDSGAGAMTIGKAAATSLALGASDITTTVLGPLEVLEATGKGIDTTGAGGLFLGQANATSVSIGASDAATIILGAQTILGGIDTTGASAMTIAAATATNLMLGASDILTTVLGPLHVLAATTKGIDTTGAGALHLGEANATSVVLGASDAHTTVAGDLTVSGNDIDSSAATMTLGQSTATKVEIADASVETEIQGTLDVNEAADFDASVTFTPLTFTAATNSTLPAAYSSHILANPDLLTNVLANPIAVGQIKVITSVSSTNCWFASGAANMDINGLTNIVGFVRMNANDTLVLKASDATSWAGVSFTIN